MEKKGGRIYCQVDDETSPTCVAIEYNGVRAVMAKTRLPGGDVCWSGVPVDSRGSGCKFSLVITSSGTIIGGGAVNFFAAGGWNSAAKRGLSPESIASTREALTKAWLHHVTMVQTEARKSAGRAQAATELNSYLPKGVELYAATADNADEREAVLAMMGVPRAVVTGARAASLSIGVDLPLLLRAHITPKFAVAEPGDWDENSELAAIASNLPAGTVALMQRYGYKLVKASEVQRREEVEVEGQVEEAA